MIKLWDYRDIVLVRGPREFEAWQQRSISRAKAKGRRVDVHTDTTPVTARIEQNRLIVDCQCGAGNAVDPDHALARCGECGAIHTDVILSPELPHIIALLEQRPMAKNRTWWPTETLADLRRENDAHEVN